MVAVGVVIVALVVLIGLVVTVMLRARRPDGVDSFRRQIDALSPEARRPTIDQMKPSEPPSTDDDGANGA